MDRFIVKHSKSFEKDFMFECEYFDRCLSFTLIVGTDFQSTEEPVNHYNGHAFRIRLIVEKSCFLFVSYDSQVHYIQHVHCVVVFTGRGCWHNFET